MRKIFAALVFAVSIIVLETILSCSEKNPTNPQKGEVEFSARQITGCKTSLAKISENSDSIFTYTFNDTLKIEFRLWGNCCPDSNRFFAKYKIKSGTIFVEVQDTAKNQCYCNCDYDIHLEFVGLSENQYLFHCTYPRKYMPNDSLRYREIVLKN